MPLRKPLNAEPYTSDLLFQGTRVMDDEAAEAFIERMKRAKARQAARKAARS